MRSSVSHIAIAPASGSRAMINEAERLTHYLAEQPLVLTALGAAIGAAIGAAMPRTRMENEVLGEASDRFKETAQSMARSSMRTPSASAGEAFEDVKAQGRGAGPLGRGRKAAVGQLGDKLASVADHATSKIRKEAEEAKAASGSSEAGSSASSSMGSSGGGTDRSTSGSGAGSSGGAGQSVSPTSTTGSETSSRKPSQGSPQPPHPLALRSLELRPRRGERPGQTEREAGAVVAPSFSRGPETPPGLCAALPEDVVSSIATLLPDPKVLPFRQGLPAVDDDGRAGDVVGVVRGEEEDRVGDVVRRAEPAERHRLLHRAI